MAGVKMVSFWDEIKKLEGQVLRTLDRGNRFEILNGSRRGVIVKPLKTRKERLVPRKDLEGAYKELVALGEITRSKIEARHSPRNPVYVAAMLAELPGVSYTLRPIHLRYKRG
jgi:hypothetical protein